MADLLGFLFPDLEKNVRAIAKDAGLALADANLLVAQAKAQALGVAAGHQAAQVPAAAVPGAWVVSSLQEAAAGAGTTFLVRGVSVSASQASAYTNASVYFPEIAQFSTIALVTKAGNATKVVLAETVPGVNQGAQMIVFPRSPLVDLDGNLAVNLVKATTVNIGTVQSVGSITETVAVKQDTSFTWDIGSVGSITETVTMQQATGTKFDVSAATVTIEPASGATFDIGTVTGTVTVAQESGQVFNVGTVSGTIAVTPESGATFDIGTVAGNVNVQQASGTSFDVSAATVTVQFPSAQDVTLTGSTATLTVEQASGTSFDVSAATVTVQFPSAQDVTLAGQSVDITVAQASGAKWDMSAATVTVQFPSAQDVTLTGSSATVTVEQASGTKFDVSAATVTVQFPSAQDVNVASSSATLTVEFASAQSVTFPSAQQITIENLSSSPGQVQQAIGEFAALTGFGSLTASGQLLGATSQYVFRAHIAVTNNATGAMTLSIYLGTSTSGTLLETFDVAPGVTSIHDIVFDEGISNSGLYVSNLSGATVTGYAILMSQAGRLVPTTIT